MIPAIDKPVSSIDIVRRVSRAPHNIKAERCRRDFFFFVKEFWDTIIQDPPIWNWHIEYLCEEMKEAAYRVMARLPNKNDIIVNIPPGTTKSTIITVMFNSWVWIARLPRNRFPEEYKKLAKRLPEELKHVGVTGINSRFITSSYSSPLSLLHSEFTREIIKSDKYQLYFPEVKLKLTRDAKSNFANTFGGDRFATSTGGTVTGMHGHFILVDDPINPEDAEAIEDAKRKKANSFVDRTLSSRKVDKKVTVTVLIMQRLHEDDPTGHLLGKRKKIKHICLPGDDSYTIKPPELKEKYIDGLLDPKRLDREILDQMLPELGQYGYAGQVGQNPTPPEGGMFKPENIKVVNAFPEKIVKEIRYWDKAGTEGAGAFTAGVRMCLLADGNFGIMDVVRGQWASHRRERTIKQTAAIDGRNLVVVVEQEPGSAGKESAENTIRGLAGFSVKADSPTGDKVLRADPFSVQVNAGNVYMIKAEWNSNYIEELRNFPVGKFKDQVDASSGAFKQLTSGIRPRVRRA